MITSAWQEQRALLFARQVLVQLLLLLALSYLLQFGKLHAANIAVSNITTMLVFVCSLTHHLVAIQ